MAETETLYYTDPYRTTFRARVLEVNRQPSGYAVILDRTCFYPEGGGQPADRGTLGGIPVTAVKKADGHILHILPRSPDGDSVEGVVDWGHRFDYMQQHSGQHILSGILFREMGYATVSVHLGEDYTSIEIEADEIGEDELVTLENEANAMIRRNLPITTAWTSSDDLERFALRRETRVTGRVRIVRLGDYDTVACGGVHCGSTGEVGLVKVLGTERIRGRVRILFALGRRAYEDYRLKSDTAASLCGMLSAQVSELRKRVAALLDENTSLKQELTGLKNERLRQAAEALFDSAYPDADGIRRVAGEPVDFQGREIIDLAKHLIQKDNLHLCLALRQGETLLWCIACSENLSFPFDRCRNELFAGIGGKGGGKPPLWQGIGGNPAGIEEFFRVWRENTA